MSDTKTTTEKKEKKVTPTQLAKPKFEITPNIERVIIRRLNYSKNFSQGIIIPGQLKAGENLLAGEIVAPGNTDFKIGQIVYYSEYSASALINIGSVLRKEQTYGSAANEFYFVVAKDDIMAYEKPELRIIDEVDFGEEANATLKDYDNTTALRERGLIIK